ncbi:MAG: hypothetical protein ACI39U_06215, partial [Candidatus Cryptobacteroides sp.]
MAKGEEKKYNTASRTLLMLTIIFTLASIVLTARIIQIKYFWEPDPRALKMREFKVQSSYVKLDPQRGDILDCNGRLIATSIPKYDVGIDCKIQQSAFREQTDKAKDSDKPLGVVNEEKWKRELKAFTVGLAEILDDGRSAEAMEKDILRRRESENPKVAKTICLASGVDYKT